MRPLRAILEGRETLPQPLAIRDISLPVIKPDGPTVPLSGYRQFELDKLREQLRVWGKSKPKNLVIAGPSGSGKSRAIETLMVEFKNIVGMTHPWSSLSRSGNISVFEIPIVEDNDEALVGKAKEAGLKNDIDEAVYFYPRPLGEAQIFELTQRGERLDQIFVGAASCVFPHLSWLRQFYGREVHANDEPLLYAMLYFHTRHPDSGELTLPLSASDEHNAKACVHWVKQLGNLIGWDQDQLARFIRGAFTDFDASTRPTGGGRLGIEAGFSSIVHCIDSIRVMLLYYIVIGHFRPEKYDPERCAGDIQNMRNEHRVDWCVPIHPAHSLGELFETFNVQADELVTDPAAMKRFLETASKMLSRNTEQRALIDHLLAPLEVPPD